MDRSEMHRLLSRDADAELDPADRARLEAGLLDDPSVARDRALFALFGQAIREDPEATAPPGLSDRVRAHVASADLAPGGALGAVGEPSRRLASVILLRRSAFAAAAALLVAGIVHVAHLPDQAFAADPAPTEHFVPSEELDRVLDEREQAGHRSPPLLRWLLGRELEESR